MKLRIGTRASPLALIQVDLLIAALRGKHPGIECEIVKITTTGDKTQAANTPLPENGGKGFFLKEIEEALIDKSIDCAVHSMKDVPGQLPEGLVIPSILPRDDPRDAFFSKKARTIKDLPPGAVVGSTSPRRAAIILSIRPDLKVVTFRGNVDTRLKKLEEGVVDATILAAAGLRRLGRAELLANIIEPDVMLPAVAQGAIGVEIREDDDKTRALLAPVNCPVSQLRVTAERAYLSAIDGSCKTAIAALMSVPDAENNVVFDVLLASPDGSDIKKLNYREKVSTLAEATALGQKACREILAL